MASQILRWIVVAAAPLAWVAATAAFCIGATSWILATPGPSWAVAALLSLAPVVGEIAFTRWFEVPVHGWRAGVVLGLAGRLAIQIVLVAVFVWLALALEDDPDGRWLVQDLTTVHHFVRVFWLASPPAALALGTACAAAYVHRTVRGRRGRLTTTAVLPGLATIALYILMYYFPDAALRGGGTRPDFIERVWAPTSPYHRYPREVMVTPNERYAIATFGSSFPFERDYRADDVLDICQPNPGDCRPNLVLIDLRDGSTRTWEAPVIRRFYSEASDRFFLSPWNTSALLELTLDGTVRKHPLPGSVGGGRLREVNATYYAADSGRVYMTNGNNPVVLAWSARTGQLEHVLQLAGWNGIVMGDTTVTMARSRSKKRLYVWVKAYPHQVVEIAEDDFSVQRTIRPAPDAYGIELSPDEQALYLASFFSGRISRYATDSLELEATFSAPIQCRRMSFSPDGARLFAASYLTGELAVYDTRTDTVLGTFYVAPRLEGMHVATEGLYLLSSTGLYRIPLSALP